MAEKINLLGVGISVCKPEKIGEEVLALLEKKGPKQIVFLNTWDFLKARRKNKFAECVRNADLVLPISKGIIKGAKFLKKTLPVRYNPFDVTIDILSTLEEHYKSLYLLGGRKKTLMTAEKNIHGTFSDLQIVGRYVGYYPKSVEDDIIQAVYKACPSLVIVSEGVKENDCWIYSRKDRFNSSIFLYYHDFLGICSNRIKRVSKKTFEKGFEFFHELMRNPLKIVYFVPYLIYILTLVWYRLFRKDK